MGVINQLISGGPHIVASLKALYFGGISSKRSLNLGLVRAIRATAHTRVARFPVKQYDLPSGKLT